jgi:hypothetical protein
VIGERSDGRLHPGCQRRSRSEAWEVKREHIKALGQSGQHCAPYAAARSQSMDQHERFAMVVLAVAGRDATHRAFGESGDRQ